MTTSREPEPEERAELPYLPFRPPRTLEERLRLLWDLVGPGKVDPRHPSQYTPEIVGYDPVAEAEQLLRETT